MTLSNPKKGRVGGEKGQYFLSMSIFWCPPKFCTNIFCVIFIVIINFIAADK